MRPKTIIAASLIALGLASFAYQAAAYMTGGGDMSAGPMRMARERTYSMPLPPIFGMIALIGGIAWLLVDTSDLERKASPR